MSRVVEVDRVVNEIARFKGYLDDDMIYRLQLAIKRLPEADAIEVVRCKDCKYWRDNDCKNDSHGFCPISENDFCSRGEKREDTNTVRHGQWVKTGQSFINPNKFMNYFCSECGLELDEHIRSEPNYCPNCGARMDGE